MYYINIYEVLRDCQSELDANEIAKKIRERFPKCEINIHRLRDVLNKMETRKVVRRRFVVVGKTHKYVYAFNL